jgi:hypothetical protein
MIAQKNFTLTHFADHHPHFSHDAINRYLNSEKVTPRMMWENIRDQIVVSPRGYLVFDDSVMDKNFSHHIELVRRQYSGNAHGLIRGIGVVNCVYVNPDTSEFWPIDFRIYDIDGDGKTKLVHVEEMLNAAVADKLLTFQAVLMDGWYAKRELMLHIESLGKIYYCPLADNRLVDDSGGKLPYRRVDGLEWSTTDLEMGKLIKINKFPKNHKVKLFRVEVAKNRTDWVVTNDLGQNSLNAVQKACGMRWKIEQFHREIKQVTGVEKCQCRSARAQRNHIACAMLAWTRLKQVAKALGKTIYQVKMDC